MIEQGIVSLLTADPTLAPLINSTIYAVRVPEDATYPAMSFLVVSSRAEYDLGGRSTRETRIQFDMFGRDYSEAKSMQYALRQAIDGYQGVLPDSTIVFGVELEIEQDLDVESSDQFKRTLAEYVFHYIEP